VRRTLGYTLRASYKMVISVSFFVLIIVMMAVQITSQVLLAQDISDTLSDACAASTQELINATLLAIIDLGQLSMATNINATADALSVAMGHNEAAVSTAINFLLVQPPNASDIDIATSLALFIQLQMLTDYYVYVDWTMIAPLQPKPGYLDSSACVIVPQACNRTIAVANYSASTLVRCPTRLANSTTFATAATDTRSMLLGGAINGPQNRCRVYANFSITQLPPVLDQVARAGKPNGMVWSREPFVVADAQLAYDLPPVLAVAASWPYRGGAIYCPLTTESIASITRTSLLALLFAYSSVTVNNTLPDPQMPEVAGSNSSTVYIVDLNGFLLGAAWGSNATEVVPIALELASQSSVTTIRLSAAYLLHAYGTWNITASRAGLVLFFQSFANGTVAACQSVDYANCTMIGVKQGSSPQLAGGVVFSTAQYHNFVVVSVVDVNVFVNPLGADVTSAILAGVATRAASKSRVSELVGVGVGVAVAAVVIGFLLSLALARVVTHPLARLSRAMKQLRAFRFADAKRKRFVSRVTDVAEIERGFLDLARTIEIFAKFVPASVVKGIVSGKPTMTGLHVESRVVTVLFSDIRGFTNISEKLAPDDLLYLLTRYLTAMTHLVESHDGVVSEILGDGLLCFFGAPDDCADHASKACACALAMQRSVRELSIEFASMVGSPLEVRVGVNTGPVLAGNLGSPMKLKYGCLGDAVNTASRLEGLCKYFGVGILASDSTRAQLREGCFVLRRLDEVILKGKAVPTWVFEVIALAVALDTTMAPRLASQDGMSNGDDDSVSHDPDGSLDLRRFLPSVPTGFRARIPLQLPPPTTAHALIGPEPPLDESQPRCAENYERAWALLAEGKAVDAVAVLTAWVAVDEASALLAKRAASVATGACDLAAAMQPTRLEGKDF